MSKIAFLGAGNIAQAIMGGLVDNGFKPGDLSAFDPVEACRARAAAKGIRTADSARGALQGASVVLLCVKPHVVTEVLAGIASEVTGKLVISVAAGVTIEQMIAVISPDTAIIRCMPNTPALVQTGMTGMYASDAVDEDQRNLATTILGAVGKTLWVDSENALDIVTAVSGSGPAYFFLMMEAMINAAQQAGLDREVATTLVLQTALGAARMADGADESPAILRANVTSPGGTTAAALEAFASGGFEQLVGAAIDAARQRSIELSTG